MMKFYYSFWVLLLFSFLPLHGTELSSVLSKLDAEILRREFYLTQKETSIQTLKQQLELLSHTDEYKVLQLNQQIYDAYKSYQCDSAYVYAAQTLHLAKKIGNKDWILRAYGNLLFCFFSGGAFKEAADIVESEVVCEASPELRGEFYALCVRFYSDMYNYSRIGSYRSSYRQKLIAYRDSALNLLPHSSYIYHEINTLYDSNPISKEKIKDYQMLLSKSQNEHQKAIVYANMSNLYLEYQDTLQAISCLVNSAVSDLKEGVMETTSKTELARLLYEKGYLEKANKYVHLALEEANYYNATHRILSINAVLPIIERAYLSTITSQRDNLKLFLWFISFLMAGTFVISGIVYRQKNKLKKAGKAIEAQRTMLSELHEIKDVYILEAIRAKSDYLEKTEDILKKVDYRIKSRQYTELNRLSAEFNLKEERKNFFQTFDRTFLMLFPDFISSYNRLFEETDQIKMTESTEKCLTPELRIFALIRLGITDNEEIARFLNLSVNTIYAYKTKVKAKARIPKENFDDFIRKIPKKSN